MEKNQAERIDVLMKYMISNNGKFTIDELALKLYEGDYNTLYSDEAIANKEYGPGRTCLNIHAEGDECIGLNGRQIMREGGFVAKVMALEKVKKQPFTANKVAVIGIAIGIILAVIGWLLKK